METSKAIEQLSLYITAIDSYEASLADVPTKMDSTEEEYIEAFRVDLAVMQAITEQYLPDLLGEVEEHPEGWTHAWRRARRALIKVRTELEKQI